MSSRSKKKAVPAGVIAVTLPPDLEQKIRGRAAKTYRSASQLLKDLAIQELIKSGDLDGINGEDAPTSKELPA